MTALVQDQPTVGVVGHRRAQRRQATYDQLMSNARTALAEGRPLSLRAIAADMGMTAPALYRYVDSLAELQHRLSADIYDDVIARMDAASGTESAERPGRRLVAALMAFRQWALERPEEFRLVFDQFQLGWDVSEDGSDCAGARSNADKGESAAAGTSGASTGGSTDEPAGRGDCDTPLAVQFFAYFLACIMELADGGKILPPSEDSVPAGVAESVKRHVLAAGRGRGLEDIPLGLWWSGLRDWIVVCGIIRMEVDGLVPQTVIDRGLVFRQALENWGQSAGADDQLLAEALDDFVPGE